MKKSQASYKSWKEQPIKEFFEKTIKHRKVCDEADGEYPTGEYCDEEDIEYILLRNFDETVEFLTHATMEETACAIVALENLIIELPKDKGQILVDIFKNKLVEFPDIVDNCIYVYLEELEIAQNIIDGKDGE